MRKENESEQSNETRRAFLNKMLVGGALAGGYLSLGGNGFSASAQVKKPDEKAIGETPKTATLTPQEALEKLLEGNKRYASGKLIRPNQTSERRIAVAAKQSPFAIVLSCSDSRVVPEIAFDEGIGDLFVIRTAGNVSDDIVLGSIEYAVEELKVPLVMVMGHQNCGAVTAVVKGGKLPGHIFRIADAIKPAVEKVKDQPGDAVDNAVRSNVKMEVAELKKSEPILEEKIKDGKLMIVGGRYDLSTGLVEVIA